MEYEEYKNYDVVITAEFIALYDELCKSKLT